MSLPLNFVQNLQSSSASDAWRAIFKHAWEITSQPIALGKTSTEITRRENAIADIDHFLATGGYDLWNDFEVSAPHTVDELKKWWVEADHGRAVLILDAFSLREVPFLLEQAKLRGYKICEAKPLGSELPADTTPFAKALGFSQRSSLSNNQAGSKHAFPGARTESAEIDWLACADLIGSEPDWVFWHHWPDHRLHDHDSPGKGLTTLSAESEQHLTSDSFWAFIDRLTTGRRLVITSDHGYAASGLFPDSEADQTEHFKSVFKSGRWSDTSQETGSWMPPIDLLIETKHGQYTFVNGRRKWKSAGGYPTLPHGGLTVLEVTVPFIEIKK